MNLKKILILMIFSINISAQSVKTQEEIVRDNLWEVFKDIPRHFFKEFYSSSAFSHFNTYTRMNDSDPQNSPFRMLNPTTRDTYPSVNSHPDFLNNSYDFKDIVELDFGVCSGLAYLMRKFHQLAYFDSENRFREKVPHKEVYPYSWRKFYKEKLDRVFSLEPTIFPYFSSFNEITKDPELRKHLLKLTLAEWVKKNVSMKGLIQLRGTQREGMSPREARDLFYTLSYRLSLGYKPIVYLAKKSDEILSRDSWIHVLPVYHIEFNGRDGYSVQLWDINERPQNASKTVTIRNDGKVIGDFGELVSIFLYPQDDYEIGQTIHNKLQWCKRSKKKIHLCETGEFL